VTTSFKNRYTNKALLDDEEINSGGLVAAHLAWALSVLVDDQGRLSASVKWIWKEAYKHLEEVSLVKCRRAFQHLDEVARFILLYRFEGRDYLVIRNWHRFQPQKVDRVRWSSLPAPPGFDPTIHLPKRLYEQWLEDKKKPGFSAPPISNEWISGGRPEPFRFRHVSGGGDEMEDERSQTVTHSGTPPARAPVDEWKSGQSGRSGRHTRGDVHGVGPSDPPLEQPVPTDTPTTHAGNGGPIQWSDWARLPETKRRLQLTNWFFGKHGWMSVKPDTLAHEHAIAEQIAGFAIQGPQLLNHLNAWWDESDPDDRPSSLEYFWTRLQQLENEGLKQQQRPHVRTSGLSQLAESLPDIQGDKGSSA